MGDVADAPPPEASPVLTPLPPPPQFAEIMMKIEEYISKQAKASEGTFSLPPASSQPALPQPGPSALLCVHPSQPLPEPPSPLPSPPSPCSREPARHRPALLHFSVLSAY